LTLVVGGGDSETILIEFLINPSTIGEKYE